MARTHEATLGSHPRPSPRVEGITPRGTPARGGSALFGGHPLDSLDRGPMARAAPAVWEPQYVLAAAQAVGGDRGAPQALADLLSPTQRPAEAALG
jgi:hypothetical protein